MLVRGRIEKMIYAQWRNESVIQTYDKIYSAFKWRRAEEENLFQYQPVILIGLCDLYKKLWMKSFPGSIICFNDWMKAINIHTHILVFQHQTPYSILKVHSSAKTFVFICENNVVYRKIIKYIHICLHLFLSGINFSRRRYFIFNWLIVLKWKTEIFQWLFVTVINLIF